MKVILAALVLMSFALQAEECADLVKCTEFVSKLTGKKYMYDKEFKGGLQTTSNMQITAENAEVLFTSILEINGYGRVPTGVKDTYKIIALRDIRYEATPVINVDAQTPPSIPQNSDYYMMNYKFKHFNQNQLRATGNSIRPFMSRYARIIELKGTGSVSIQETAAKLLQQYEMVKAHDRELTKEEVMAMEKEEKKQMMREKCEGNFERKEGKREEKPGMPKPEKK
jgi:general secretion pathway protein D